MTMLFSAHQAAPHSRYFVLTCPHATMEHYAEADDDAHDAEMLGSMVKAVRRTVAAEVWAGRAEEMCTCEPKGWKGVSS